MTIDPNGYIAYCPCMGRFGNQADHFLGSFAFAKDLNRTLILPPWISFSGYESNLVPFDFYFDSTPMLQYHRVILMQEFMLNIAPTVWPPEKRIAFCWSKRQGAALNDCNAKDGNPFKLFWDHFHIDFVGSEFYGDRINSLSNWNGMFTSAKFPVLAFVGAPAQFPVLEEHRYLHKYLKWSKNQISIVETFIGNTFGQEKFLGIHLRNDLDWPRVCELIGKTQGHIFSSAQCLGENNENGELTISICQPSKGEILSKIENVIEKTGINRIFVASDKNHMLDDLEKHLNRFKVKAYKLDVNNPQADLAILGRADHFIGNCVSSFSAFVKRERDVQNKTSSFWGLADQNDMKNKNLDGKVEL